MALSHTIEFVALDELSLDPRNPRLGRRARSEPEADQECLMDLMRDWSLEELAISFLENGFWPQEAVIVVQEDNKLVVVEGNRRIAALKYLKKALVDDSVPLTWRRIIEGASPNKDLFESIPYILADSREDIVAFLGFRHVTGIKQWAPTEKAEVIAQMVDDKGMSYEEIRKQIGSRVDTVRRNYIAYRVLQQIDSLDSEVSEEGIGRRFSVLFLSLREAGVQSFLGVDIKAEPQNAQTPVSEENIDNLSDFAGWLFGTDTQEPLVTDSRQVGDFSRILSNPQAVEYLQSSPNPSLDIALQEAGVEVEEVEGHLREANIQIQLALGRVHFHRESDRIREAVERLAGNAKELISGFPSIAYRIVSRDGASEDA